MDEGKHVIIALGKEYFGIPILKVEAILNDQHPVRMPRTPKMLLGVFQLRGKTLAAIDLRLRLDMPEREGEAKFVVMQTPSGPVSLRVDSVVGISELDPGTFTTPDSILGEAEDAFLAGVARVGDKLVAILNMEYIVPQKLEKKVKAVA